jgi:phage terminase small subunit
MRKKSISELKAAGSYRPDRHAGREVESGALLTDLPPAPVELSEEAAAIYEQEGRALVSQKMLKITDLLTLSAYALEMSVYLSEMRAAGPGVVVELPNGISTTNAHRKAAETALKNAGALSDKLGLSPAARHRIKGAGAFVDEKQKPSPILEMMRGRISRPPGEAAGGIK